MEVIRFKSEFPRSKIQTKQFERPKMVQTLSTLMVRRTQTHTNTKFYTLTNTKAMMTLTLNFCVAVAVVVFSFHFPTSIRIMSKNSTLPAILSTAMIMMLMLVLLLHCFQLCYIVYKKLEPHIFWPPWTSHDIVCFINAK